MQVKDTADSKLHAGMTASPETQKKFTGIMSKVSGSFFARDSDQDLFDKEAGNL